MIDMCSTKRLLDLIFNEAGSVDAMTESDEESLNRIVAAAAELRRRGDEIVRRGDLRSVAGLAEWAKADKGYDVTVFSDLDGALARIENRLGGTL